MKSGKLRHYITLQESTDVQDSAGQPIPTWSNSLNNWPANVQDVQGNESIRGGQITATATHVVETRYDAAFTQDKRIVDQLSRTLEIIAVKDKDGRQRYLELHCRRVSV